MNNMKKFIFFSVILYIFILICGSFAFIFSMRQIIRENNGSELSKIIEIERIKLEAYVNSEISITLKMASSPLIKGYFTNPGNIELEKIAFAEIAAYREAFASKTVFWINDVDKIFYFDDNEPFFVDPQKQENYWYNMTLYETEVYNFNINYNPDLKQIRLWINAPVLDDEHKPIGMLGTGIELSTFINTIYQDITDRVEFYFFNNFGEITCARQINLVEEKRNIEDEMAGIYTGIFDRAKTLKPGEIQTFNVLHGKTAVGSLPVLEWYSAAFMPDSINDYKTSMTALFFVVLIIISLIFVVFNVFISVFLKSLHRTMESLQYAKNEAEEASKSKTSFLATMSHEIRTPMSAIIGVALIQLQKGNLPEEYKADMERIYVSGKHLLRIINDVLDMSKIETGKLELMPEEYEVASFINDAVQLNIVRIGSKPVEFTLDIDENMPSMLYGDELRLKQILNNLLSNAIKYTEKGSVKLSINHYMEGEDVMLRFTVEDTGQGMKDEDKKRLFSSEYLRFNAEANRATEGTGLGLNITKKLVDMMDGKIRVESEYGKGSRFTVTIKQKAVECDVIGADLVRKLRNFTFAGEQHTESLRITRDLMPYGSVLVVDDVDSNLFVAEGLLSPYKLNIETAESGFSAIEKVESGKTYDIIFMDHMMPQMDGIETTQKLRKNGYKSAIVALTANALVGNEEMFAKSGFDGFIPKPIDIKQLNAVLNKFIRDKYPEEAKKYKPETTVQTETAGKNPKLLKIFCRDAEKAIATLRETTGNGGMKLFTTTAHAMKSALANVGENEASAFAAKLESAGLKGDTGFISANTESFIETLIALIKKLNPAAAENAAEDITEDNAYLAEQMQIIKTACENYEDTAAYAALDRLKEKSWKAETAAALENIREALFLHSDFDAAAAFAGELLNSLPR